MYFLPLELFTITWCIVDAKARFIGITTWILILLIYILAPGEPRYILVAWGLYASLGAWGVFSTTERFSLFVKLILPLLLILPIGYSFIERSQEVNKRIPTIIGLASVDEYFEKSLDIWPLIKYINTETDPEDGVILVEPRVFYFQRPYKVWYPYETMVSEEIDLPTDNRLESWKTLGFKHLMLTYGPNYRALTLFNFYNVSEPGGLASTVKLPDWVPLRARYAEKIISGGVMEDGSIWPDYGVAERRNKYDLQSIDVIDTLIRNGYLQKIQVNKNSDNVGLLFEINYDQLPEEDLE